MSSINASPLLGAGADGYQIERSLRFNSADSAYLELTTGGTAGNQTTWTFSCWVKRSKLGTAQYLFNPSVGGDSTNESIFQFNTNDKIRIYDSGATRGDFVTTQVFRDTSAWYHIVVALDTTQGTSTNRFKLYVNGVQVTTFDTASYPGSSVTWGWNRASTRHRIGAYAYPSTASNFGDFYLTEIHHIDGQALTPSSFGETDTITGVWKPKKYAGTYGTNGFYLKFADNSGTTSTTLGKDSSGNGNNWTPNNFSVTAGAGNDSLIDTPTPYADGGNGRGNYCTWNPLAAQSSTYGAKGNLVNGNLDCNDSGITYNLMSFGTLALPSSGKWYFEVTPTAMGDQKLIGICNIVYDPTSDSSAYDTGYLYKQDGNKRILGTQTAYGATYTTNDVIGVAVDMDATPNASITFYKNGVSQGVASSSISKSSSYIPYVFSADAGTNSWVGNFGQRAFSYTPPAGFLALNTQNLPEPSIKKPSSYMDVKLYTGNSSTQTISGLGFSPDLVWIKSRSNAYNHGLQDAVRGAGKTLYSNLTNAEDTQTSVTAFNSDGFSLANDSWNQSAVTYAAWCWDESATPGFDIVTYAGNSTNRTIAHSLGVTPSFLIVKNRSASFSWRCWFTGFTGDQYITLNETSPKETLSTMWGSATPTSTTFAVGTRDETNNAGNNYVAYLWSEVAGFSKFGSYTGNGSADGPFVFTGHRSRFLMVKRADSTGNWLMYDAARVANNVNNTYVYANSSAAENADGANGYDFLSNGFKVRNTYNDGNISGATYVFASFAENPFKYSLAR